MSPRNLPDLCFDNGIRIIPFERSHQAQVIDLFRSGLESYATLEEDSTKGLGRLTQRFVNDKLEKDMKDIFASYIDVDETEVKTQDDNHGLCFLSALDPDDTVLGCVGIKTVSPKEYTDAEHVAMSEMCELVRMSVHKDSRGLGLGKKLVGAVEEFAKANGFKRVCLSTLRSMAPAVALYKSCGYRISKEYELPLEKIFGPGDYSSIRVVYFHKDL